MTVTPNTKRILIKANPRQPKPIRLDILEASTHLPGKSTQLLVGLLLLVTVFIPAFLLLFGALPFWEFLRQREDVQRSMAGINAAVVGVLGAALYDPVWTSAIHARSDFALALAAFGLLLYSRRSPVLVVALTALAAWLLAT